MIHTNTTSFLWIRHAAVPDRASIYGRTAGVTLSNQGREEARLLAAALESLPLAAIYCSPQERTRETAGALSTLTGTPVQIDGAFDELDYGGWTGKTFSSLSEDNRWRAYNSFRSGTRIPGGEWMLETQARAAGAMLRLHTEHPGQSVAIVSHGDVIRAALSYALGSPLDLLLRLEVAPASLSIIRLSEWNFHVGGFNLPAAALKSEGLAGRLLL